jgi:hypothetical protein
MHRLLHLLIMMVSLHQCTQSTRHGPHLHLHQCTATWKPKQITQSILLSNTSLCIRNRRQLRSSNCGTTSNKNFNVRRMSTHMFLHVFSKLSTNTSLFAPRITHAVRARITAMISEEDKLQNFLVDSIPSDQLMKKLDQAEKDGKVTQATKLIIVSKMAKLTPTVHKITECAHSHSSP